jgi:hypothetical protein
MSLNEIFAEDAEILNLQAEVDDDGIVEGEVAEEGEMGDMDAE